MGDVLSGLDYFLYYYYLLYYNYIGYPFVMRVCICVVIVCALSYLLLAFYLALGIFLRKDEKSTAARIHKNYYDRIKSILSDTSNHNVNDLADVFEHDIKKRLKHREMRVLVKELILIKMELGDNVNEYNMQSIQGVFKIGSFFEREIQFGRSQYKVQALLSIQSVGGYISEAVLVRFLYHRKVELRLAARFAYMYLSQNNPLRFFDEDRTMKLRYWDMAEIHAILLHRQKMGHVTPNFFKWASDAVENDVRIFFVNEIRLFNEQDSCASLIDMLNTKTWSLRNEIIRALGEMKYVDAESKLIDIYDMQPEYIKQNILNAVSLFNTGGSLPFLRSAYINADDLMTKLCALQCIYNYGHEGQLCFNELEQQAKGFTKTICDHIRHPLTSHS